MAHRPQVDGVTLAQFLHARSRQHLSRLQEPVSPEVIMNKLQRQRELLLQDSQTLEALSYNFRADSIRRDNRNLVSHL